MRHRVDCNADAPRATVRRRVEYRLRLESFAPMELHVNWQILTRHLFRSNIWWSHRQSVCDAQWLPRRRGRFRSFVSVDYRIP